MSMGATSPVVKRRKYNGTSRQERARLQHDTALDAARTLFLERGYASTTVDAIAEKAGVSLATIYKTYGGKAGLTRELCRRALEGSADEPAEDRSDALRSKTAQELISGWGQLLAEVSPLVSPLVLVLRTAAETDEEVRALYDELERARLYRMRENAKALVASGRLPDSVTVAEARDVLWLCSSAEVYDLLVGRRGWSPKRYAAFVTRTLMQGLLG